MENYHYLNQKGEFPLNQEKILFSFNNNLQFQNFFRGDSNINKQKGRVNNINNKKEIHFTKRAKEKETTLNGPKMLTMNFPPGFMITDNNNSRKTASHEKNICLQQNMANNMELNDIGSDNEKVFSNTVKKGFDYNYSNNKENKENIYKEKKQDKKNIDIFGQKQKSINIIFNNNENLNNFQKKKIFYNGSGSSINGFNSTGNTGYIRSETELNSGRGASSTEKEKEKDKNYEIFLNRIRTESSDLDKNISNTGMNNYKSNSNTNIPFNMYINSHQNNKIYNANIDSDINNNYSSNNSNNSKDKLSKNSSYKQKNMQSGGGSSNNNKLVFNPSSITNQRIIKKNSDSELGPSSINQLYLGNKKNNKKLKQLNNHLSYSNINDNFYKKNYYYYYHHNKSENQSNFSPDQNNSNSHSKSKDNNHTKTQINFDKNTKPNYYENLINELKKYPLGGPKLNFNSEVEYNKHILEKCKIKKKIDNLNIGITYKKYNGYKYYFNIPNEQIYILKECSFNEGKGILPMVKEWNKYYENDGLYLKIYDHEIDSNQRQIILVIQYPIGGESVNDIINSVGFYDQNLLFDIITKIYKAITKINNDKSKNSEKYINTPFCLCDIFMNVNENIKIISPLIRQININSKFDKNINNNNSNIVCKCKTNISLLLKLFNINKDSISFFCLGFSIIQIITQNLIFELDSYKYIFKTLKTNNNIINLNNNLSYNNKNISFPEQKCCLAHLLLDIEKQNLNGNDYLLLSHFLNLYPKSLLSFLHECTSFKGEKPSSSNEFLNLYDTNRNLNLSIKEILEITVLPKNEYIKFDVFLSDFEILYKDIKINADDYIRKLNCNKVIQVLSRAFNIDKEIIINKISEKIEDKDNYANDYNEKSKIKEKNFIEDMNNLNSDNYCSIFVNYNKKKDNRIFSNNIFNKKNRVVPQMHNYRSSENYDYDYI